MRINDIGNFLLHPLSPQFSRPKKVCSVLSVISLVVITAGLFLIPFTIANLRNRNIQSKKEDYRVASIRTQNLQGKKGKASKPIGQIWNAQIQKESGHLRQRPRILRAKVSHNSTGVSAATDRTKVDVLKRKHAKQLAQFEVWARANEWQNFETSHYDWWIFPISRDSAGQGSSYTVYKNEIAALKNDPEFMKNYRRGVDLVVKSWGWDLSQNLEVQNKQPSQRWIGYGVRLGKMADSLRLFGEKDLHARLQTFAYNCARPKNLEPWVKRNLNIA
ncbi:MAG: hypothetical protein ACI9S8_001484 [Chlamydiales bacterium]|jgi:hypothetical protein